MKRYFCPILIILVLTSGLVFGCSQKQQQQEMEESLNYLDMISTLGIRHLKSMGTVLDTAKTFSEVLNLRDESRLLEVSAMEKYVTSQALDLVNSELSSLENVVPPREAQKLHGLVIKSLRTAQTGLVKWSHASAINYDRTYALLHPSVPKKEFPSVADEMQQARQLVFETIDDWDIIKAEWDKVFETLGLKVSSTKIYQNKNYSYSAEVPKTWTISETQEKYGHIVILSPAHNQMEITIKVSSEESLENSFAEARSKGVDVKGMTPLELMVRYRSTDIINRGVPIKRIDWNDHALTTFTLIETKDYKSWTKTCYIVDIGNFYIIEFKVLGYSDSEFENYRNQINEICKSFRIQGSTAINLPEGKTIFDF